MSSKKPGSAISRQEVLSRAQYWVDRGITYTQTGTWATDPQGKKYRRDCSGLVSMCWRLTESRTTSTFKNWSGAIELKSLADLQPGDALLRKGHIELFVRWVNPSNHKSGAYVYSFNNTGDTVANPSKATKKLGRRGKNYWSEMVTYGPIRYRNIVENEGDAPVTIVNVSSGCLKLGSKGDAVVKLQRRLTELGYPTDIDGSFGPDTAHQVREFQRAVHIDVDGVVGPITAEYLRKATPVKKAA